MPNRLNHRPPERLPVNSRRRVPPDLRKRVAQACNECNARKVKCSGGSPCMLCASNSRDCVYPVIVDKVTVPRTELEELRRKVDIFEKLLAEGLLDHERQQSIGQFGTDPEVSPSTSRLLDASQLKISASEESPDGILAKLEPSESQGIGTPACLFEDSDGIGRYLGESSGAAFLGHLKERLTAAILLAQQDQPALSTEKALSNLGHPIYDYPPLKDLAVNPFWLPSDATITAGMEMLRELVQDGPGNWPSGGIYWWGDLETLPARPPLSMMPAGDAIEYRYLAFYNAGLALVSEAAALWKPRDQESQEYGDLKTGDQYYARANMLAGNPLNVKGRTIKDVAALGMLALYLIEICAQDAAYMCITTAIHLSIALGAHRVWADERSKRIFWSTYVVDRWLSCLLGRPHSISDDDIHLPLPENAPSLPPAAGLRAHVELSRISGHVVKNTHHKAGARASELEPENTIQKLEAWLHSLPPELQLSKDGTSNDVACSMLHMRRNQLFIVALRPYFYSAIETRLARCRVKSPPPRPSTQFEHLKRCVAAGRRNIRLAAGLVGRRMMLHPIGHYIFNAGICIILGNLVLSHEISPEQIEADNRDVEFAIQREADTFPPDTDDPASLADILRELQALAGKLTTAPSVCQYGVEVSEPYLLPQQQQQQQPTQEIAQFPMQVGENNMLYDELMGWMGDNWPMYDMAYMGEQP